MSSSVFIFAQRKTCDLLRKIDEIVTDIDIRNQIFLDFALIPSFSLELRSETVKLTPRIFMYESVFSSADKII
jgi:hypothetical protein